MWYKENSISLIIDGKRLCVQLYSECAKSSNYTVIKQKKFSHLCNVIYWRFLFSVLSKLVNRFLRMIHYWKKIYGIGWNLNNGYEFWR